MSALPVTTRPSDAPADDTPPRQQVTADPHAALPATSSASADQRRGPSRLYVLDLLRFGAALSVMGYHLLLGHGDSWHADTRELFGAVLTGIFRYGWMGVECFFVISGFVICMSTWGRSLSDFFISRVTRLMPAYVFAVLLTSAALALWPLTEGRPEPTHILINATMLQGFLDIPPIDPVYWTLLVELKFYLYFAIVARLGLTYRRVLVFCVAWLLVALFAQYTEVRPLIVVTEAGMAPFFVAGITLYLIHRFGPNLLLWTLLTVSIIISVPTLNNRVYPHREHISFEIALIAMFCFFALMVAVALGWFSWLRWRGLVVLGALTYPLYLLHLSLSRIVADRLHDAVPPWALLASMAVGLLLLAYLTHRLVERPLAPALRRRLRANIAQIRAADRL